MKIATLAAMLAALSLPIAVSAQVAPQPGVAAPNQRGSGERTYDRWMKRLSAIGLSAQQQQQVQNVLGQYGQQHPPGSPRDPQAAHALRDQIFSILTPDQQGRLRAEMQAMRAQRQQRREQQQQQQPQQQPPPPTR